MLSARRYTSATEEIMFLVELNSESMFLDLREEVVKDRAESLNRQTAFVVLRNIPLISVLAPRVNLMARHTSFGEYLMKNVFL